MTQPDAFGLFLYKDQGYQRLPSEALAHRLPATGYLVYRRAERPDSQGAAIEKAKTGSERPESGAWEEEQGARNSAGEPETTVDPGGEDPARGGGVQPGEPKAERKAEGSQAAKA